VALLSDLDRVDSEKFTECNVNIMFRNIRVHPNVEDLLACGARFGRRVTE
jgi:hypothetical protein